jgi:hypothetical protein
VFGIVLCGRGEGGVGSPRPPRILIAFNELGYLGFSYYSALSDRGVYKAVWADLAFRIPSTLPHLLHVSTA